MAISASQRRAQDKGLTRSHLPSDIVKYIVRLIPRFRDLSSLSVLSQSWFAMTAPAMDEVRDCVQSGGITITTEPDYIAPRRRQYFALEYSLLRLSNKASAAGMTADARNALMKNAARIWETVHPDLSMGYMAKVWFGMRDVDLGKWEKLAQSSDKFALALLSFHPKAATIFKDMEARDKVCTRATEIVEAAWTGATPALVDQIKKLGTSRTASPFGSPFKEIVLGALTYAPHAHGLLINLVMEKCSIADFLEFAADARVQFPKDKQITNQLIMGMARLLPKAKEEDLSTVPEQVVAAVKLVFGRYLRYEGVSKADKPQVKQDRNQVMWDFAHNIANLVKCVSADHPKDRRDILEPVLSYIKENAMGSKEWVALRVSIKRQAAKEQWLTVRSKPDS